LRYPNKKNLKKINVYLAAALDVGASLEVSSKTILKKNNSKKKNVYLSAALALGAGLHVYRVLVLLGLALIHCVLFLLLILFLLPVLRLWGMAHTDAVVDALAASSQKSAP
jgi:hypothetical protein